MKSWILMSVWVLGTLCSALADGAPGPVTLVNGLTDRPVFNYTVEGVVQTRALAPGERVILAPGLFSGLGLKKVPLVPGTTYYMARFGAIPSLFRLPDNQVLILNESGVALEVTLGRDSLTQGTVGSGNLALGAVDPGKGLSVSWDANRGVPQTLEAPGGRVYRWIRPSPDGVPVTEVSLIPWE